MIIELHSNLKQLYPLDHKFSERELNAWRIMLRNIGCHDVTPFSKQASKVNINNSSFVKKKNIFSNYCIIYYSMNFGRDH